MLTQISRLVIVLAGLLRILLNKGQLYFNEFALELYGGLAGYLSKYRISFTAFLIIVGYIE